ncbi:hypothetical protein, unlikely [Trypanosoma brucei gambiense DAL972]|uniref:Uncharacterized protein n=1 Tax=Trypanosoma brucei gambiense (strain MHOM/CI/86/DAL972) TaxID=679716 RepID=D0A2Y5_TRYB9|nr:hypothetical protein, unlikely [Trypanosoma brucei gambiense DAL972]CBH15629.1 hypothetical protein, unlikely [Trypanosoma brucei gambiense DAL972]|eukprot:XP_011777893.1 hypothetical protein, unlikely [Trypanosoma brucei gambiense DAL972]
MTAFLLLLSFSFFFLIFVFLSFFSCQPSRSLLTSLKFIRHSFPSMCFATHGHVYIMFISQFLMTRKRKGEGGEKKEKDYGRVRPPFLPSFPFYLLLLALLAALGKNTKGSHGNARGVQTTHEIKWRKARDNVGKVP